MCDFCWYRCLITCCNGSGVFSPFYFVRARASASMTNYPIILHATFQSIPSPMNWYDPSHEVASGAYHEASAESL